MPFRTFFSLSLISLSMPAIFASTVSAQDAAIPGIQPNVVATELSDDELMAKAGFLLGYNSMRQMTAELDRRGLKLNTEQVLAGAKKALDGEEVGIEMAEIQMVMEQFQKRVMAADKAMQERMMAEMRKSAEENAAEGKAFLAENAKKEGVKMLNGIQYEVLTEGTGAIPKPEDKVRINYHGTYIDGKVFDSTTAPPNPNKPAKPYDSVANGFVKGFNQALQAMPVGSKWRIVLPPELAYGLQGNGPIEPNQTLIFEVELLEILN